MTAKEKYENSLIILKVLEQNIWEYRQKMATYKLKFREVCDHPDKINKYWEDLHKNEDGTSIYCKDCDKYLGEV